MTDVIEKAAEAIYSHHKFGSWHPDFAKKPKWVQRGNSDMQLLARDMAQAAYTAIVGDKVLVDREGLEQARIALQNSSEIKSRYEYGENEQDRAVSVIAAMLNASEEG